jgi:hypothetical protein
MKALLSFANMDLQGRVNIAANELIPILQAQAKAIIQLNAKFERLLSEKESSPT